MRVLSRYNLVKKLKAKTPRIDYQSNRGVWFSIICRSIFITPYELPIIYSFNYSNFSDVELESKAQKTLSNFLGFVRKTFNGLLENGQALNSIYQDCIANSSKGKKVSERSDGGKIHLWECDANNSNQRWRTN